MKLLNIYEVAYEGGVGNNKTLVYQVIIRTKKELAEIVRLLNSKVLQHQRKNNNETCISYVISFGDVMIAPYFIDNFSNR